MYHYVPGISKSAFQFIKTDCPFMLFGDGNENFSGTETAEQIFNMLLPGANTLKTIMSAKPDVYIHLKEYANAANTSHSFLRLYVPDNKKLGGGVRVKKITILDNWQKMAGSPQQTGSYSIIYDYTKNENGKVISSGVASYEPGAGGEENPCRQPLRYIESNILMDDYNMFLETPLGESLYPSAQIIYSQVKVTTNPVTNPSTQKGSGYSMYEFYTSRDFPYRGEHTDISTRRKPRFQPELLKIVARDFMYSTQGYSVITNDMHGKAKSESEFGEAGNLVHSVSYYYHGMNGYLYNTVPAISKNGTHASKILGVEMQITADVRENKTESFTSSANGNLESATWYPPLIVLTIIPEISGEVKHFSSMTITKHVRQQGIIDSVVTIDKGSRVNSRNIAWDEETGEVLLTKVNNEFSDFYYQLKYPAHWIYSGMDMAFRNISQFGIKNNTILSGSFEKGDEVIICSNREITSSNSFRTVITSVGSNSISTDPPIPAVFGTSYYIHTIRSGRRNLATMNTGTVVALTNPLNDVSNLHQSSNIIDASMTEYTDFGTGLCLSCHASPTGPLHPANGMLNDDFHKGVKGTWKPVAEYKFLTNRLNNTIGSSYNPSTRSDGVYQDYFSFWQFSGNNWTKNPTGWQSVQINDRYDAGSRLFETKNALGVYSSIQFSNIYGLTHSVASNTRYFEFLFDGFEDDEICQGGKYNNANHNTILYLNAAGVSIDSNNAHTGYSCLLTGAAQYHVQLLQDQNCKSLLRTGNDSLCDCKLNFSPIAGKKYILSVWIKDKTATGNVIDYNKTVTVTDPSGTSVSANPKGQIIDGWQRLEIEFTAAQGSVIHFPPNTYLDDLRIFPVSGEMKSFVYDRFTYRLMAALDENNYATFFQYDSEGNLNRKLKETEDGIITLIEVNTGKPKK
jgi:hypothetical protein